MLPLEIFEHKRRWKPEGFRVTLHSDWRDQAKSWCKTHVDKQSWDVVEYTDVYGDTWLFEHLEDSDMFMKEFKSDS